MLCCWIWQGFHLNSAWKRVEAKQDALCPPQETAKLWAAPCHLATTRNGLGMEVDIIGRKKKAACKCCNLREFSFSDSHWFTKSALYFDIFQVFLLINWIIFDFSKLNCRCIEPQGTIINSLIYPNFEIGEICRHHIWPVSSNDRQYSAWSNAPDFHGFVNSFCKHLSNVRVLWCVPTNRDIYKAECHAFLSSQVQT